MVYGVIKTDETVTGSKNEHYELQMEHGERNFNIMQKCQLKWKWSIFAHFYAK